MGAFALVRAEREDRVTAVLAFAGLAAWLAYTRVFWALRASHAVLPGCPFLALTGHPCPLCGGTRSFAAMWHGDVVAAVRYHPLGPALFVGTVIALVALGMALVTGRTVRLGMRAQNVLYVGAFAVLIMAWAIRLVLLPLPRT